MPSIDVAGPPPGPGATLEKEEAGSSGTQPIVGIIYPPPEVRNIVDKTASFVARNGPEFESRIRQNELNNPKFNFLNNGDPYNAYYQHKVKEIREGKSVDVPAQVGAIPAKTIATSTQQKQQQLLKQMDQVFIPKDPPPDFEFMADPPSISALDLDIVKLTAQFVARNGRQFLTNLMNREQRNYQFDFLRPQHSLFQYFTKLLEQYTKILIPPKDLMNKLKEESTSSAKILENVKYRADWIRHQEAVKRKEEMALEKERVAYAQIDWHDFVVVETVDYMPGEIGNFPPPTTPDEVGARVLQQERQNLKKDEKEVPEEKVSSDDEMASESEEEEEAVEKEKADDDNQVQDMEEESSSEDEEEQQPDKDEQPPIPGVKPPTKPEEPKKPMLPPLPPSIDKVIIKKGYDPKAAAKAAAKSDDFLISPINGERIPASKVQQHMKIGLLDPRWVEQRDKTIQDRINQENVYAPGSAIEANLKQLAERRTDIFGTGDEETAIGKKIGEEDKKKDDKVTWDGYTSSVEAATRAARANITIEEQIHQIHKVKGLLPDEEKEKIGPKPVGGKKATIPPPMPAAAPMPPLPPPPKQPPQPPLPPSLPPPPGIMPPPQPPIMMVPAPIRPPLMVPGPFPVVPSGPPGFMAPPGTQPVPPPPPPQIPPQAQIPLPMKPPQPLDEDEPPAKKAKTEEQLISETEFLSKHKSPVLFKVIVPNMSEKSDWRLNGQIIELSLQLNDTVSTIKSKLQEATGMPPAKQKLHQDGLFFKDSNTLAYYNINNGGSICLGVKERGGRRK